MTLFQMDFFLWILVLMLVTGGFFIISSLINFHENTGETESSAEDILNLERKLNALGSTVLDADQVTDQLSDMSKNVLQEFDNKYNELLYLYNLIDEKLGQIGQAGQIPVASDSSAILDSPRVDYIVADDNLDELNPKFAKIMELQDKGLTIDEMARELNMGKGEIALILNLGGSK